MPKPASYSWKKYITKGIRYRIQNIVELWCKKNLQKKDVWSVIHKFQNEIKKYPQFTWSYDRHYTKYYAIYSAIRKHKPHYVLECGSGISSAIILFALKENGHGTLITMDEDKKYGKIIEKIVENPVHISHSEKTHYKDIEGTKYATIPDHPYDFIFVDGPVTKTIDLDAFYFLEKNPKTKVLIDNRKKTSYALLKKYPGYFNKITTIGYINF